MKRRKLNSQFKKYKTKMDALTNREREKLNAVEQLTLALMKEHGVSDYRFKWGYGSKYYGKCTTKSILIEYRHALNHDMESIKNTILHEIAHAIVGINKGHREEWQKKAKELGVIWYRKYHK